MYWLSWQGDNFNDESTLFTKLRLLNNFDGVAACLNTINIEKTMHAWYVIMGMPNGVI